MWQLIITSLLLGVGLAMDACAVSMTNGMNEPKMKAGKAISIAAMFAFFQALMPMIGWLCVSFVVDKFVRFEQFIPYIAFVLLAVIGGKMLYDGVKEIKKEKNVTDDPPKSDENTSEKSVKTLTFGMLTVQSVATSIDALSCGFSLVDIAGTDVARALICVLIIAAVTFAISVAAVFLGKKFGDRLGDKAQILGGAVLIGIGLEILIKGIFF